MAFLDDDPTRAWMLRSNSGREQWLVHGGEGSDRLPAGYRSYVAGVDVFDGLPSFSGGVTGLTVDRRITDELRHLIEGYMARPEPFELALAGAPGPALVFSLGPRSGVISSIEKPVAGIRMESPSAAFDFGFVVDQSCLVLLVEDLNRWLRTRPTNDG